MENACICCLGRVRSSWRPSDDGSRLLGFKPLIVKHKPYHDVPDSDDSETEEFNINVNLNGAKAYRTQQQNNPK